jgi:hypothetical protein
MTVASPKDEQKGIPGDEGSGAGDNVVWWI